MLTSVNPYDGSILFEFDELTPNQIDEKLQKAQQSYINWKETNFSQRSILMHEAANVLRDGKEDFGKIISLEMGKPIAQAIAEVEKCAWVCDYYAKNAENFLAETIIETDANKSYTSHEPLGVLLAVMPWNYPFWQVFRFAAPSLMAGNTAVLKHASNVMKSAEMIEKVFELAGFPTGVFQNLKISSTAVEAIIKNPIIKAVTLTGSKPAGASVASTAAKHIKKSVLELGGNNAFIVAEDADIDNAVHTLIKARFQNTGQSCIAAKRLLIHENIADAFLKKLVEDLITKKSGDPIDEDTFIGVMARENLAEELEEQLSKSVAMGAKIIIGGKRDKAYFEPTIVVNVTTDMPVFKEETFGPLLAVTTFKEFEEAIALSNDSEFGLGVSIFTKHVSAIEKYIPQFNEGAVFINEMVKSDPRLPFGGIKISGYGRELSKNGILEFVNTKTVYIK